MELNETIELMKHSDYQKRFIAEYYQLKIRHEKLHKMIVEYEAGTLKFIPSCPVELLKEQKLYMEKYLHCLEARAEIEGIEL